MEIYLIRHGQTGGNVAHRHQAEDTPLTKEGEVQAQKVAELVKELEPTHLLTSSLVRAVETARVIGDACNLVPQTSYNFIELRRPDYMYGNYHRSVSSFLFYIQWYFGMVGGAGAPEGESYAALLSRFRKAQAELASYPDGARVAVVSHTAFINLFLAHLCREKKLRPCQAAGVFYRMLTMPNTQMVPVSYKSAGQEGVCGWSVGK